MSKKFLIISILVISGGIASGVFLGLKASESKRSSVPQVPEYDALAVEDAVNFSKIKACYPSDEFKPPVSVKKLEHNGQVLYQTSDMYFEVNQFGVCKKLDIPRRPANLSEHIPNEFAIKIKKSYWEKALDGAPPEVLKQLFNTPYSFGPHDPSQPFFPEDVEALKQLGHTVGPNASVFQTREEYLNADPYFPIVEEGSRKAQEILEKRRRQQQQQP